MKRWLMVSCCFWAACGGAEGSAATTSSATSPAATGSPRPVEKPQVEIELVADVTRIAPGQEFALGTRFDVEPGWHIYWVNPGQSGLPTEIEVSAPRGFEVGPVRYPGPERFESPGPVVSFGYEGSPMLSVPVVAPDPLPDGPLEFRTEASWLACKESCVRGRKDAALALEVATPRAPSQPDNQELFEAHRVRLPVPWAEIEGARHEWTRGAEQTELSLIVPGNVSMEFFPSADTELALVGRARTPGEQQTSVRLLIREADAPPRIGGVVALETDGSVRFAAIDLPFPPTESEQGGGSP